MSFSERWSAFWGDDVDKALAGKDFVIVTLRDYYYYEYAIDMRQIRELLKEDLWKACCRQIREKVRR